MSKVYEKRQTLAPFQPETLNLKYESYAVHRNTSQGCFLEHKPEVEGAEPLNRANQFFGGQLLKFMFSSQQPKNVK